MNPYFRVRFFLPRGSSRFGFGWVLTGVWLVYPEYFSRNFRYIFHWVPEAYKLTFIKPKTFEKFEDFRFITSPFLYYRSINSWALRVLCLVFFSKKNFLQKHLFLAVFESKLLILNQRNSIVIRATIKIMRKVTVMPKEKGEND